MLSAKEILKDICETAVGMEKPCSVAKTVEGISVRLDQITFTVGTWTLRRKGEKPFTTSSVFEAETKLNEMLKETEAAA